MRMRFAVSGENSITQKDTQMAHDKLLWGCTLASWTHLFLAGPITHILWVMTPSCLVQSLSGLIGFGAPPCCGMQMLNANLYAARHKAAKQQNQNMKLFSDIAIGAFRVEK